MAINRKIIIVEDEFIVADDLRLTLEEAGNMVCGIASSVEIARSLVKEHNPGLALLDIHLKGKLTGIDFASELRSMGIPFIFLSAYSNQAVMEAAKATQPYGFLVKPFREKDILVAIDIARYRHENSLESALYREQQLAKTLVSIESGHGSSAEKLLKVISALQPHVPFDFLVIGRNIPGEPDRKAASFHRIGLEEYQTIGWKELITISGKDKEQLKRLVKHSPPEKKSVFHNGEDFIRNRSVNPIKDLLAHTFGLRANLVFSFQDLHGEECNFSFFSRSPEVYQAEQIALLGRLYSVLENTIAYISVDEEPKFTGMQSVAGFSEIIGNDTFLLNVLDQASQVAPFDTSVLILGETGTGKEKIASSIHELSARVSKPFIKINCAVLPPTLVESELFGHEKGSFTGATEKRIGKFEQADGGTIFLDEIGEMPIDMQAKLLRVLQEHVIERVGGNSPIKINVRIIAATNRVLEKEIAEGRFRMDLFYRLSVFPLQLPPLRNRKADIETLANYFAKKFSKKVNKPFHGISERMLVMLKEYHWPGNIRELENIVEQSVILSNGTSPLDLRRNLEIVAYNTNNNSVNTDGPRNLNDIKKIQSDTEKDYIISILKKSGGRIRGEHGAAQALSIPASTLESKMTKLGIKKEDYI